MPVRIRRRTVLRGALLVLGGVIINVAVAWGVALWGSDERYADVAFDLDADDLWAARPAEWPEEPHRGGVHRGFGFQRRWSLHEGPGEFEWQGVTEARYGWPGYSTC